MMVSAIFGWYRTTTIATYSPKIGATKESVSGRCWRHNPSDSNRNHINPATWQIASRWSMGTARSETSWLYVARRRVRLSDHCAGDSRELALVRSMTRQGSPMTQANCMLPKLQAVSCLKWRFVQTMGWVAGGCRVCVNGLDVTFCERPLDGLWLRGVLKLRNLCSPHGAVALFTFSMGVALDLGNFVEFSEQ